MKAVDVLAMTLANTSLSNAQVMTLPANAADHSHEDAKVTIQQCVRQLEIAIHAGAIDAIVQAMLALEVRANTGVVDICSYYVCK